MQAVFSILHISQNAKFDLNQSMHVKEIRRLNLELLIAEAGSAVELAEQVDTNEGYLSQLRNETNERGVGHKLAKRLEDRRKKTSGWMDHPHPEEWRRLGLGTKVPSVEQGATVSSETRQPGRRRKPVYPIDPNKRLARIVELWPYLTDESQQDFVQKLETFVTDVRHGAPPPSPPLKRKEKLSS